MNANIMNETIEMTKAEAKAAGKLTSKAFEDLGKLRAAYPGFQIVIKSAPKCKDGMKGLTVSYMQKYILSHDDQDNRVLNDFYTLRGLDSNGNPEDAAVPVSYGELRQWFLETYPKVKEMRNRVDAILAVHHAA